jgi:hypothetical protein
VALHGLRCGLSKTKGGSQRQKSDAKQRNFHGGSPWRRWLFVCCSVPIRAHIHGDPWFT